VTSKKRPYGVAGDLLEAVRRHPSNPTAPPHRHRTATAPQARSEHAPDDRATAPPPYRGAVAVGEELPPHEPVTTTAPKPARS